VDLQEAGKRGRGDEFDGKDGFITIHEGWCCVTGTYDVRYVERLDHVLSNLEASSNDDLGM
jgi:hypothetical protein